MICFWLGEILHYIPLSIPLSPMEKGEPAVHFTELEPFYTAKTLSQGDGFRERSKL